MNLKKLVQSKILVVTLIGAAMSSISFAGGVHCKQCPAESNACMPKPNCAADKLPFSDTLTCIQQGLPQTQFTIEENQTHVGEARITSKNGQSQNLRFTETLERLTTRNGIVRRIKKNYFHPYYEYNLVSETAVPNTIEPIRRPTEYLGTYTAEQNGFAQVSCKVIKREKN